MEVLSSFRIGTWPDTPAAHARLIRLNIYSALYVEWGGCRVLVDPAKILSDVLVHLRPNLILASHESMDHFDASVCLRFLESDEVSLVGSWGVIALLSDSLDAHDARWKRIFPAVPGAALRFGDLEVSIEPAVHCEYATPVFFDLRDVRSGFRLLNAIDTEITPRMRESRVAPRPDLMLVPLGIALAASPERAWEMVQTVQPRAVMASHFNSDPARFVGLASPVYNDGSLIVCGWHEGVTVAASDPEFRPDPVIGFASDGTDPEVAAELPGWVRTLPDEQVLVDALARASSPETVTTVLCFLTWHALAGRSTARSIDGLFAARDRCLASPSPVVVTAYLLAIGSALGYGKEGDGSAIQALRELLTPEDTYLDYWVLESWGRSARNRAHRDTVIALLNEVAQTQRLFEKEAVRRKLMWEVFRMVEFGYRWPELSSFLWNGHTDPNPDVRLLAYKTLPLCASAIDGKEKLLADGLNDKHEDVLEWAINAHIDLLGSLGQAEHQALVAALPRLLTHRDHHVRTRANVAAELAGGLRG